MRSNEHRRTMETLLQTYLALDDQCVEHSVGEAYAELTKQRTKAAQAIVDNFRLTMHTWRTQ